MPKNQNSNSHRWKEGVVPTRLRFTVSRIWDCQRGDCKCIRTLHTYNIFMYERDGQIYRSSPRCHGDIPLNDQRID